jgi:pSer/pThr/pTyr-binding forkhead associated (FHA) protein
MGGWVLHSGDDPPITLRLPPGAVKTIGRTARADFIVDRALVSRVHCRLTADRSNQLVVEDLGSTNGTMVNGKRVKRTILRAGDHLTVGRVSFEVRASDQKLAEKPASPSEKDEM